MYWTVRAFAISLFLVLATGLASGTAAQTSTVNAAVPELAGLDQEIIQTMSALNVPGLAVGVVRNGEVIYAGGFGWRDIEQDLPVTPQTLFGIASCTKPFNTLLTGMLVNDGILDWDQPVKELVPEFELWDDYTTRHITLRDMATHRSGLPRHSATWVNSSKCRSELFGALKHLEPTAELREHYQYNNLMYMASGHICGLVTGHTWEELVQARILDPLQMDETVFTEQDMRDGGDFALGYDWRGEGFESTHGYVELPLPRKQAVAPAGGIISNVDDMLQWLSLQLSDGHRAGELLISPYQLQAMHAPQATMMRMRNNSATTPLSVMGLGWKIEPYRGHYLVAHEGVIGGYSAEVALLPDQGIGVVVLSNAHLTPAPAIVRMLACDRLLGLDPSGGGQGILSRVVAARSQTTVTAGDTQAAAIDHLRVAGTKPSHALADYCGIYSHPAYGEAFITESEGVLWLDFHRLHMPLDHYHYEIFTSTNRPERYLEPKLLPETYVISFHTDEMGVIDSLEMPLEPTVDPITFSRTAVNPLQDTDFVASIEGNYDLGGVSYVIKAHEYQWISVYNDRLGNFLYYPQNETTFVNKDDDRATIKFCFDNEGGVTAIFGTPGGFFEAVKVAD